jgi:hypothetical protein
MRRTRGAPTCVATDCSRPCGLLRRSVFAVIARDFTDNVAINIDLHVVVHAMSCPAPPCPADLANVYTKHVPEHAPTADGASGGRCVAPSGRSAAAYGPSHRLPMRLPRRIRSWWSHRCIDSRPAATLPLRGVASCARSSSPSSRTDDPGCRRAASHGAGHHVRARSSSNCRVLLRLLRVPPPRLYRLCVWPLLAFAVPIAYTVVFVHYDFIASVIDSSSTSLLLQPPTALAPLRRSASCNRFGASSASPSTWREVHTGPALRMLGAGNTTVCLRPQRIPVPGKLGSAPRLHRPRQRLLWHRLLRLPRPRHPQFFLRTRFWQNCSMPTPRTCA